MKKILILSKEEARALYNLLSSHETPNRSDNRKRFIFLDVIEDFVFKFEDDLNEIKGTRGEKGEIATRLGEEEKKFTFNDREAFAKAKDMFEKSFETGVISRNDAGRVQRSPLVGRDAKVYMQLENRFADVKDIKEKKK